MFGKESMNLSTLMINSEVRAGVELRECAFVGALGGDRRAGPVSSSSSVWREDLAWPVNKGNAL